MATQRRGKTEEAKNGGSVQDIIEDKAEESSRRSELESRSSSWLV